MIANLVLSVLVSVLAPVPQGGQEELMALESQAAALVDQQPAQAVELLRRVLTQRESAPGEKPESVVRVLNSLAYALSRAGDHEAARSTGEMALVAAIAVAAPSPWTASVRRNLAGIALQVGELRSAREHAEAAVRDAEAVWGKVPIAAEYREFAAMLAMRQGQLDDAIVHLGWDLAILDKMLGSSDPERVANPAGQLAQLLRLRGQRGRSLELHSYALGLLDAAGFGGGPSWRRHLEARIAAWQELGEFDAARAELRHLIEGSPAAATPGMLAGDRLEWAGHWLLLSEPEAARSLLAAVPRRAEDPAERFLLEAQAAVDGAHWPDVLQACEEAQRRLLAAAPAHAKGPPVSAELARLRAAADRGLGKGAAGLAGLLEVLEPERGVWGDDTSRLFPTLLAMIECELQRDQTSAEMIDFLDLLEDCDRWLPVRAHATLDNRSWWLGRGRHLDPVQRAWLRLAHDRPKRLAKAFLALDRLRQRRRAPAAAMSIDCGSVDLQVAQLLAVQARERDTQRAGRSELADDYRGRLAAVAQQDAGLAARIVVQGADLATVRQEQAARGVSLLTLSWSAAEVVAMWLPVTGDVQVVPLGSRDALQGPVRDALHALATGAGGEQLAELGRLLLQPLWPHLEHCEQLVVVADGPLAFVPFEALPTPDGRAWVQSVQLRYAPSVSEWLRRSPPRVHKSDATALLRRGQGAVTNPQFSLVAGRVGPQPVLSAPALDRQQPAGELTLASETEVVAAAKSGQLRALRRLEVLAPTYVDAVVPGATGILLGAPARDDLPLWERDDGYLDLAELRSLSLDVGDLVLWSGATLLPAASPAARDAREAGLMELVASCWDAGAERVLVAGWLPPLRPCFAFDAMLREELTKSDPERALCRAQRRWLQRVEPASPAASPAVWARLRCFGR